MWWANAATPLTAASVTITYNAPAHSTFVNIHQFAVSGLANSASPWDVNGSLPASAGVFVPAAAQVIQVPGVSTTNANDFLLWTCFGNIHTGGAAGSNCDWPLYVGAQGWLNISAFYQQNIFTAFFDNSSIWQLPVLATQSSATFTALDPAVSANVNWIASVDALVCVGGSPPPSGTLPHVWVHE
jgi:hypothetical protein